MSFQFEPLSIPDVIQITPAMREMERSLDRMNKDYLDLVLHHFPLSPEMVAELAVPNGDERGRILEARAEAEELLGELTGG